MTRNILFLFLFFILFSSNVYGSNALYSPYEGLNFKYRWLDIAEDTHTLEIEGLHTSTPHQFGYEFQQILGDDTLTKVGLTYAYKAGSHWAGIGLISSSDKPFTSLNLIDFDVFYAFKVFQHITEYENIEGKPTAYYSRLYLGFEYSSNRKFLDGYPLPVIRYEFNKPNLNIIFGLPLTYINVKFLKYSSVEFKYVPVLDIFFSYNFGINKENMLQFQVDMETDAYKLSNIIEDVYFSDQKKYYTDTAALRLRYAYTIKDMVKISPFVEFIMDSHKYVSKEIRLFSGHSSGFGYSAGIDITAFF